MGKSTTFSNDLLKQIFWGTAIADISENDTTSPATNYYLALHTADPTAAGTQTSSECTYTGYSREIVPRDNTGFAISTNQVSLAAQVAFGTASAGTETVTHFSLGTASSGTGKILYSGQVSPNVPVSPGVEPILKTTTTITET